MHDLHSGILSDADQLRMEEIAKTDPFIRDALEGYQAHADHDHSLLLKVLSERIQNKSKSRRPKLLPLSRGWVLQAVAASLVLILATWAVIYYVGKEDEVVFVAAQPESSPSMERSSEVLMTQPAEGDEDLAVDATSSVEMKNEPSGLRANAQVKAKDYVTSKAKESATTDVTIKETDDYTFTDPDLSAPASALPVIEETRDKDEETSPKETETMAAGADDKSISKRDEGFYANLQIAFDTFLEYLKNNSRYPVLDNFNPTGKEVTVEFRISSEGRPTIINIINSSAEKKYIAEAMRLIKNGPNWVCEEDKYPCVKRYTIYFQ